MKKRVVVAFANDDGSDALRMDCEVEVSFIPVTREYVVRGPGVLSSAQHRDLGVAILDWLRLVIIDMNPTWNSAPKPDPKPPNRGLLPDSMHPEIDRLIAEGENERR